MKKVLLFSLSLVLGFSAFAQQRVSKGELSSAKASAKKTVVGKEASTGGFGAEPRHPASTGTNRSAVFFMTELYQKTG